MTIAPIRSRRFTIGGSEAGAACGVDPYRSRIMLWALKTGRAPEPEPSEAMEWGTLLEPVILAAVERRGYELLPAPAAGFTSEARPFLVGHPDAFAEHDGRRLVVDAKTTSAWNAGAWDDDGAPTAYVVQLHHYMHVTGCEAGLLACLVAGQRLHLRLIERDPLVEALMLTGLDEFARLVRSDVMPAPDGSQSASDALRAMFASGEPDKAVRLDRAGMRLLSDLRERREQLAAVKEQVAELENRAKALTGKAEAALTLTDEVAWTWRTHLRASLDTARLKRDHPALHAEYTVPAPVRRFKVTDPRETEA